MLRLEDQTKSYEDPMSIFIYALKASESRRQYPGRLKVVLDFLGMKGDLQNQAKDFLALAKSNPEFIQSKIISFVQYQKERANKGDICESTIRNYYKAAKLFLEMNDVILNWKKITRGLPKGREAANDRAPTVEEIKKLVEYPDRRIKGIVYTMASSGIRIGAWDYLRWKHVAPIKDKQGDIIAAKIMVYAGDREEYYSFITPEAYHCLNEWMEFRKSYGENVTEDSWLMRDIWQTTNKDYRAKNGLATCPRKMKASGIKRILERALWEQGIRRPLENGQKRHEWKAAHGFRKFYKTRAEQVMTPINVEITMGHDIGVSASYYKPTERVVLSDYLKAIDLLTINSNESILVKKVEELEGENKNTQYIIKGKLEEKDRQIEELMKKQEKTDQLIQSLINSGQFVPKTSIVTPLRKSNESHIYRI